MHNSRTSSPRRARSSSKKAAGGSDGGVFGGRRSAGGGGGAGQEADEAEADQVAQEISSMAGRLKESSVAINQTLRTQTQVGTGINTGRDRQVAAGAHALLPLFQRFYSAIRCCWFPSISDAVGRCPHYKLTRISCSMVLEKRIKCPSFSRFSSVVMIRHPLVVVNDENKKAGYGSIKTKFCNKAAKRRYNTWHQV